ncbi:genetic competence negative regulator [Paenibacillus mucilaginosus]|uniref:Adaptor protein n=2 Tax=Paenibacillus mucilaginosus TaxID=61624 RepID=H6NMJ6_9BACL|nr:genetic competence negative regulator [Paenibacillus mucilaginosus]AEI41311.1 adaptor protein [Paenibacillus mucilaginosus KNP414]AFC29862.1 adaptor protein [Paenibacillus mucilaginosus 3016]MCG7211267.1 genetic competence negative regulator [Paenibacillus mucilaginosus]WDM30342.1 genetic competence negative regulator [Paenibacillus mucilaginosus]WFA18527.1 genetic competence negative regulator [Paenibacillus mucilaginosus]
MKMERLSQDKIRIFLTFDDLTERGIHKDDMWREIPKVHELFSEMMDQAYMELGFDATGPLAVEVLAMPAQGMMVIVTRGKMNLTHGDDTLEDEMEEVYELEVTMDETDQITYAFHDFEDLLRMAKVINPLLIDGGTLYSFKNKWILLLDAVDMEEKRLQSIVAVLSEFGESTSVTQAMLEEYGKTVIESDAVKVLCAKFQ